MNDDWGLQPLEPGSALLAQQLAECNRAGEKFGLLLNAEQLQELEQRHQAALRNCGRVEFGPGILPRLVRAFADSPYIQSAEYAATLAELQDLFYYFKNDSLDSLADDELLEAMAMLFNDAAQGSLEYLACTSLEELCRLLRSGGEPEGPDGRPLRYF